MRSGGAVVLPPNSLLTLPVKEHIDLSGNPSILQPRREIPLVSLDDPASIQVMTDFTCEPAFAVEASRRVEDAINDMFRFGVRTLLVVQPDAAVLGMITSYDIQGHRALHFLEQSARADRAETEVRHLMTRWGDLTTIDWQTVRVASAADILNILRATGASHLLVCEETADGFTLLRGLLSRKRLERQVTGLR
jgi:CBS domain-containing protein